jgi:hypothetical protein
MHGTFNSDSWNDCRKPTEEGQVNSASTATVKLGIHPDILNRHALNQQPLSLSIYGPRNVSWRNDSLVVDDALPRDRVILQEPECSSHLSRVPRSTNQLGDVALPSDRDEGAIPYVVTWPQGIKRTTS